MAKKRRSNVLERMMRDLTPEKMEEIKQRRLASIKSMTMEYQLGWFVGEKITRKYMPSLDVDMLQTNNVITVEPAEKIECERLHDAWWAKREHDKEESDVEWKELRAYHKMLDDKYLPEFLVCHISPVNYANEEEFKLGIVRSLWDSDVCNYDCSEPSDVDVKLEDDGYFTVVVLKRTNKE